MWHLRKLFLFVLVVNLSILAGCKTDGDTPQSAVPKKPKVHEEVKVRLLLTTDEHGWLEPGRGKGGVKLGGSVSLAAHLSEERNDLNPDNVLLYSIGDMWTGPYLSTLLKGEPMVKTMNALHYAGAVIGNHDFDFGQDQLATNIKNSTFPYLAANLHLSKTKEHPPWAKPYQIFDIDGVKIGILGFANKNTPETTDLKNLVGLEFTGYIAGINKYVPIMRREGAKDIAVEFTSCSKTYSMPGWRIGFAAGNPRLIAALARVKSYLDYGAFTPVQVAATAALNGPQDCIKEVRVANMGT